MVKSASEQTLSRVKDRLTDQCAALLLAYRRQCAADTAPTQVRTPKRAEAVVTMLTATPYLQLILPDAYKLLPAYTLCLLKEMMVRGVITQLTCYCGSPMTPLPRRDNRAGHT